MKPVLFSDVDGTICFHEEANGISLLGEASGGLLEVKDPRGTSSFLSHDVSTSSYAVYLAEETRQRLHALSEKVDIVLVTGGRPSTCQGRAHLLDFASAVIAENGAMIFDAKFRRDEEWWNKLQPQRELLEDIKAYIKSYDWNLDDKGRTSGIRVRLRDNPHKNEEKFARLCEVVRLPPELQSTINLNNLDIIPRDAGKDKAVQYFMKSRGYEQKNSFGIGDDINDAPFLRICGRSFVLASSYPQVLDEAKQRGWGISKSATFDGIHEILEIIQSI